MINLFTRIDFAIKRTRTQWERRYILVQNGDETLQTERVPFRAALLLLPPRDQREHNTHICTHTNSLVRSHTGCHRPESFNPRRSNQFVPMWIHTKVFPCTSWIWYRLCVGEQVGDEKLVLISAYVIYWLIRLHNVWTADRIPALCKVGGRAVSSAARDERIILLLFWLPQNRFFVFVYDTRDFYARQI